MIVFRQRTLWQSFLYRYWTPYRRRCDAANEAAIRRLVDDPSLPCMVGDRYIPNGYGDHPTLPQVTVTGSYTP